MFSFTLLVLSLFCWATARKQDSVKGMLFPRDSESRESKTLNGIWDFRADFSPSRNEGFNKKWYQGPLSQSGDVIPIPVPSSYNDITTDPKLQNFIGWAWYEKSVFVAKSWRNSRVVLRIGSAHYVAIAWVNGIEVVNHEGGHLPFESSVHDHLIFGKNNRITIAVNNTLTPTTLPPGTITHYDAELGYPPGYFTQEFEFDFFNYAGVHRSVTLYTTPKKYVVDISISSTINVAANTAQIQYDIVTVSDFRKRARLPNRCSGLVVTIEDMEGSKISEETSLSGTISLHEPNLWWPYTMQASNTSYMYSMVVNLTCGSTSDIYRQPFGIREVKVTNTDLLINDKKFYCLGVGKHEDAEIRGKGLDYPTIVKDFYMMKWLGVNCFRTSHYPYAEEVLDMADDQGIVVIDESPGVGIKSEDNFGPISLKHHKDVMNEMVQRDKNHPSVIMWSVANEPASQLMPASDYFKAIIEYTKSLDSTRPVTFVSNKSPTKDRAVQFVDILLVNKYFGWYQDTGHPEVIKGRLSVLLDSWHSKYSKPFIMSEYGAGAVAGLHTLPSVPFTEDYQADILAATHKVFDLYKNTFLAGEMVWNFADFMTVQGTKRVVGNRKGLLTRQRQPKQSAYVIKQRYELLAKDAFERDAHPPLS